MGGSVRIGGSRHRERDRSARQAPFGFDPRQPSLASVGLGLRRSHERSFPDRTDREPPGRRHPRDGVGPSEPRRRDSGERSPAVPGVGRSRRRTVQPWG